jgi:ribonuclease J
MLFPPSMMADVERAECIGASRLIYSLWSGYLKNDQQKPLLEWLKRHDIPLDECHTSGHAAVADLARLRKTFSNAPLVPVHTEHPDRFEELFGNVQRHEDGEWWEIEPSRRCEETQ